LSQRPLQSDYHPHFETYVRLVPEGDIYGILSNQLENTEALFGALPESKGNYRYAPGKWSIKEMLGHINDNERIMGYRLLRIGRGDLTPLSGYDQDDLMKGINFDAYTMEELIEDYSFIRRSTLSLIRGLPEEAWTRRGVVNGNESTPAAWATIIAGHELHHLKVLKERYLG
jgi:hypothetical protein